MLCLSCRVFRETHPRWGRILNDWTIVDRLGQIKVPTLVVNGRTDLAQDFVVAPFVERITGARKYTFENSSHTPFWEERAHFMQVVGDFLKND